MQTHVVVNQIGAEEWAEIELTLDLLLSKLHDFIRDEADSKLSKYHGNLQIYFLEIPFMNDFNIYYSLENPEREKLEDVTHTEEFVKNPLTRMIRSSTMNMKGVDCGHVAMILANRLSQLLQIASEGDSFLSEPCYTKTEGTGFRIWRYTLVHRQKKVSA